MHKTRNICVVGILVVGSALFLTKQYVAEVRAQLRETRQKTQLLGEETHMYQVEWAHLTSPKRLQQLLEAQGREVTITTTKTGRSGPAPKRLAAHQRTLHLAQLPWREGDAPLTRLAALPK